MNIVTMWLPGSAWLEVSRVIIAWSSMVRKAEILPQAHVSSLCHYLCHGTVRTFSPVVRPNLEGEDAVIFHFPTEGIFPVLTVGQLWSFPM